MKKTLIPALLAGATMLVAASGAQAACGKVTIAEMTWGSAAVAAHVQNIILANGYGCETDLVPGDTVPTVTSMTEKGEPDIAPEIWLNSAREPVEKAVSEGRLKIVSEILSDGGEEGWWVPDYMVKKLPELATLKGVLRNKDLFPDKEEPDKGRFYTCPAGWACQIINANLFKAYGVDKAGFTLFNPGSGEGLAAAIAKAYTREEPIFAYYWAPTDVLGKYPMVKLKGMSHDEGSWSCVVDKDCVDPKKNMWPKSVVYTVVTSKFADSAPEALSFISKMSWPNSVVNAILAWRKDKQATAAETATYFLRTREDVWTAWVSDAAAEKIKDVIWSLG